MPELPDIVVYIEALQRRIVGEPVQRVRIGNPFVLRTFEPPIEELEGKRVARLRRVGKRIAIGLENGPWLVMHLMIAGRLHWKDHQAPLPKKSGLAAIDFPSGTLLLTEAGSKRRASMHVVRGDASLADLDPCATCQTGGRVFADRSLSRLLKDDWPRRIEDWE